MGWQQNAAVWFGGVPDEVRLCGARFTHAQEAIDERAPAEYRDVDPAARGERPSDDWSAVAVLKLARLQLDEMAEVIELTLGASTAGRSVEEVALALGSRAKQRFADEECDLVLFDVDAICEGLALRQSLGTNYCVGHAFAVDGSITLTVGPEIPSASTIGLRGSDSGEMNDQPDRIFRISVGLTETAGALYWKLRDSIALSSDGARAIASSLAASDGVAEGATPEEGVTDERTQFEYSSALGTNRPESGGHVAAPQIGHSPLDKQTFGQLELDLKKPDPTNDEVSRAVRGLLQEAMTYRDGPEVLQLIQLIGRFTTLAPYNALLLDSQAPGCRHVLAAHVWKERWHRRVRPGQRPRIILRTFGPVLPVFDVSQVEVIDDGAPPLPTSITDPFGMPPLANVEHVLQTTMEVAKADGIRITRTDDGAASAGSARTRWSGGVMNVSRSPRSPILSVPVMVDVEINRSLDSSAAYITLAHELGHVYCGHLGTRNSAIWPNRLEVGENAGECEAEAVAYIVGLRLDATVQMPPHLARYLKKGSPVPPIDIEVVTKAAGLVINLYESPALTWRRLSERTKKARVPGSG